MITTLLFDLDDTILDFKKAEALAISKTLEKFDVQPTKERIALYSAINEKHWKMLERGEITRQEVLVGRFRELFKVLKLPCNPEAVKIQYEQALGQGHYFMPYALEVIRELSERYRMYIVSNGTASVQAGRIESAGIRSYFRDIFISEHIGYNKPSPQFFRKCFSQIPDFSANETLIIGDSPTSDILGGTRVGIKTCWYRQANCCPNEEINADYEITDLRALLPLLNRI